MQASEQVASEAAAARTQFLKSLKDQMGIVDTPLLEYIAKLDLPKQ